MQLKNLFFYIVVVLLFSCHTETKRNAKTETRKKDKSPYALKIVQMRGFGFRRNYSYSEKTYENKKLRNELDNRNPENLDTKDFVTKSKYFQGFKKLNLFDKSLNLNIKTWDSLREKEIDKMFINGKNYPISMEYDNKDGFNFKIEDGKQILAKENLKYGLPPDVSFMIYDIDNDNQDEIIAFYHSYIVNGDNYDLIVYEIEKNN